MLRAYFRYHRKHRRLRWALAASPLLSVALLAAPADARAEGTQGSEVTTAEQAAPASAQTVIVSARRRDEAAQDVPIALSVLGSETLTRRGAFTIQAVSQQAPTLQYTSSNPRNTALNVRGLGVSFGLANDGLEQGVGFYVDQVYNSRPAASAFDLLDIERIEVLRGPQGTLFGKNTTAGAVSVTTKAPSFTPEAEIEASLGDFAFTQFRGAVSGPLIGDAVAGRLAVGFTQRDGFVKSTITGRNVNDLHNIAARGQLLWALNEATDVRLSADWNLADPDCCTQVFAGVAPTLRPAARQFPAMAATLNYRPPSADPYDRLADADAPIRARSELGGLSLIVDHDLSFGTLTSVTAWRWWDWEPANDRDYMSLDVLRQSANPVQQTQATQEIRLASTGENRLDYTVGLFAFHQKLKGQNVTEWGRDAAFWLLGTATANNTPIPSNLLTGYTTRSSAISSVDSYAAFAQLIWRATDAVSVTTSLRYTWEEKAADYNAVVFGGLATTNTALRNAQLSIFRPQAYKVGFTDDAWTGDINVAWRARDNVNFYASAALGFKSGGINLAGLPFNATNDPALNRAIISPEGTKAYEVGIKTEWFDGLLTANLALFHTDVSDFQANVVDTGPGALRGYLANIEAVRSQGAELDLILSDINGFSGYVRAAFTDATYRSFRNAPCPLERIGTATAQCNLSGQELPGTSPVAISAGGEYRRRIGDAAGDWYVGLDASYRSSFFGDASNSSFLRIDGYTLANLRVGYESDRGWEAFALVRNLFDEDYMLLVTPQSGNSGYFSGLPGDPRTVQFTVRRRW